MACCGGRVAKDIQRLCRHVESQTQGQACVADVGDTLEFVTLYIMPNDGFYNGAKIRFKLRFDVQNYPEQPPVVFCCDRIYHPNIDVTEDDDRYTNICVSLLSEWNSLMDLEHVVQAILFLMHNPSFDDALSPFFDGDELAEVDAQQMEENIRRSVAGGEVEGWVFDNVLISDSTRTVNFEDAKYDVEDVSADMGMADAGFSVCREITTNCVTAGKKLVADALPLAELDVAANWDNSIVVSTAKCSHLDVFVVTDNKVNQENSFKLNIFILSQSANLVSYSTHTEIPFSNKYKQNMHRPTAHSALIRQHKEVPVQFEFLFAQLLKYSKRAIHFFSHNLYHYSDSNLKMKHANIFTDLRVALHSDDNVDRDVDQLV